MIARIWYGWTSKENATKYEALLKEEVFPSIEQKKINGYNKISLLRSVTNSKSEVEFITIMEFDSIENLKNFTGKEYEKAYVPKDAKKLLLRYRRYSKHYQIVNEMKY